MRLTTRGRYAVTALLDLALQPTEQTITLAEIAASIYFSCLFRAVVRKT